VTIHVSEYYKENQNRKQAYRHADNFCTIHKTDKIRETAGYSAK